MPVFYAILKDTNQNPMWDQPSKLHASNKQQAYNFIGENTPAEYIQQILSEQEYGTIINSPQRRKSMRLATNNIMGSQNFDRGTDFFNTMMNVATAMAEQKQQKESAENQHQQDHQTESEQSNTSEEPHKCIPVKPEPEADIIDTRPIPKTEVRYFTDNGIQFKIQDGIIYKKCWENIILQDTTDEAGNIIKPEYRILKKDTGKIVKNTSYIIQKLEWKPLCQKQ